MMNVTQARHARATTAGAWGRTLVAGACLGLLMATSAMAAPTSFPDRTTTVMLDGAAVQGSMSKLENTVVFDDGTYYLWYRADTSGKLNSLTLATSNDGVNFTTVGPFNPGDQPWWEQLDGLDVAPTVEPLMHYTRLQKVGDNWIMAIWNRNKPSSSDESETYGDYNYNTALWNLGGSPGNLNATQIGPLNDGNPSGRPTGGGMNHVGTFGIIRDAGGVDNIYIRADSSVAATAPSYPGSGFARYGLKDGVLTSLPVTLPEGKRLPDVTGNVFAGTGFCKSSVVASCETGDVRGYVDNTGRVLAEDNTLHLYYSFDRGIFLGNRLLGGIPGAQQLGTSKNPP